MIFQLLKSIFRYLPPTFPEFVYSVILRPKPLRGIANAILKRGVPEKLNIGSNILLLNKNDPVLGPALALGIYEKSEQTMFSNFCKEGMIVMDVGANVGLYTLLAAQKVGKSGRVFSIEPDPESHSYLARTIDLNHLTQVRTLQVAAGHRNQEIDLFLCSGNKADSRVFDATGKRPTVKVEMKTLDAIASEVGIKKIDLIKMDVQGAEGLALQGMTRLLEQSPNLIMFLEFWPWGLSQVGTNPGWFLKELVKFGFTIQKLDENKHQLIDVADISTLLTDHRDLQYASIAMSRSHANLVCQRVRKGPS